MLELFELERFFAKHEFNARCLLCTSDCGSMSVSTLIAARDGFSVRLNLSS